MKTTNKISSFIGGVVIAFAITLFIPSAANATWGNYNHGSKAHGSSCTTNSHGSNNHGSKAHGSKNHGSKAHGSSCNTNSHGSNNHGSKAHGSHGSSTHGSHGSNNHTTKCNKYKTLAYKYLKKYYRCYNYRYYQKYVYFIKKYKQCQSNVTVDCDKYKVLADRYLAAYNRCGYYCYYKYYLYYMNLYNKCQANLNQTGKVCGQVFEDTNSNGSYDKSDKPLANVTVKVTDSKGKVQSVTTNAKGYYCARNVATGTASVDIDESTLPDNPTQVVGTDPTNIDVKANRRNWEERNGYTFPIPTGKVCGTVYEDINGNGQKDDNEKGVVGISVKIIDANGDIHLVDTDDMGKYCVSIVEGSASITVDETTLPTNATLTAGENPNDITVIANQNNPAGTDGYTLPTPTGTVCGFVLVDGQGQANVTVTLMDSEGNTHSETTNADGKYCFEDIPQGDATVDVDDTTLPNGAELTMGEDPSDVTVVANTENDAGTDGYTLPIPVGIVCGSVLLDGNGQADVTVNILDANGDTHPATTDADGKYCLPGIPEGDTTITVDETTLPAGVVQILGDNPNTITVIANENNDAGIDGYETITTGTIFGQVLEDVDSSRSYNNVDTGLAGIKLIITDSNGDIHSETTDINGNWKVENLPEGTTTVKVVEETLPQGYKYVYGDNPSTVNVVVNAETDAGKDGYTIHRISSIYGWVKRDINGNKKNDNIDEGISGVSVVITDAHGDQHILITDENGLWFKVNLPGGTTIVDIDDSTVPSGLSLVYGTDPKTTTIIEGPGSTSAGYVGYGISPRI